MKSKALHAWLFCAGMSLSAMTCAASFSDLLVFGDSISDSGNRAADVGKSPGQLISGNNYYPSKPYGSGTYSNGPVWAQTLATSLGLPPLQHSAVGGGNFSYAFASVLRPGSSIPYSLPTQLNRYFARTGAIADSNALYVLAGGANDVFGKLDTPLDAAATQAFNQQYANAVGSMVDSLQAAGARHILVWNVPNLGLAPGLRSEGAAVSGKASALAQGMNSALLQRLSTEGPEVKVFDIYGLWTQWATAPSGTGPFANVSDACGAPSLSCDPASAIFWDAVHPTTAAHTAMAAAMQAQISAVPEPANAILLGAGLCLLMGRARGKTSVPRCR